MLIRCDLISDIQYIYKLFIVVVLFHCASVSVLINISIKHFNKLHWLTYPDNKYRRETWNSFSD